MECVRGSYLEEGFLRVIEVSSDMPLSELHLLIQQLIGFSDEQLDECFMATRLRGKKIRFTSPHENEVAGQPLNQTLAELFPEGSRKRLFYSFNFGDSWIFEIKKVAEAAQPIIQAHYPRIVQTEGIQPI
jgi:hypothetical protein